MKVSVWSGKPHLECCVRVRFQDQLQIGWRRWGVEGSGWRGRGRAAVPCGNWREQGLSSYKRRLQGPDLFRAATEERGVMLRIPGDPRGRVRAGGSRTGSGLVTASAGCPGRLLGGGGRSESLKVISLSP